MLGRPAVRWQRNVVFAAQRASTRLSSSESAPIWRSPAASADRSGLAPFSRSESHPELQFVQTSPTTSRDHGWDRREGALPRCHPAGLIIRSPMPNCRRSHCGMTCSFVALDFVMGSLQKRQTLRTMPVVPFSLLILTPSFSLLLAGLVSPESARKPDNLHLASPRPVSWISVSGETIGQRQRTL